MKTGTTWLCANLRQHPGIWLPRKKEIHYFTGWGRPSLSWPRHLKRSLRRPGVQSMLLSDLSNLRFRSVPWDLQYLFGRRTDRWYASLFIGGQGKITGDMSATYAELDRPAVEHVFALMPHAKVIYGLRNPIERAWSHALMAIDERIGTFSNSEQPYGELHPEDFIRFFESPLARLQGDYLRTFQIWEAYCPEHQFFTFFMEDIVNRPAELLVDIYRFLGIDSSSLLVPHSAARIVRAGAGHDMPDAVGEYLARFYYPQILQLEQSKRFSGRNAEYVENWRKKAIALM